MTREQLEPPIREACDVVGEHEVYVFGSQSILGQFADVPATLKMSAEADISPRYRLDRVEYLNTIGEDSPFHHAHGFYVHGLPITEAATLPAGWEERTVAVRASDTSTGLCLEGHDLAASKLVKGCVFRLLSQTNAERSDMIEPGIPRRTPPTQNAAITRK